MADPYKARAPFAPWDRRELPGLFDVEETARRVGNYKWAEMKLFEALGGWVATVPEPTSLVLVTGMLGVSLLRSRRNPRGPSPTRL